MLNRLPFLFPLLFLFACSEVGVGGQCHHRETGDALSQVRDANGDLFRLRKMPNRPTFTGTYDGCGVPVQATIEETGFGVTGFVFHPETGERIRVLYPEKGLRQLWPYEWYYRKGGSPWKSRKRNRPK